MPGRGMIDLHLHTTASDGRCSPQELVDRAAGQGVTVMSVTDHDTTAAIDAVSDAAAARDIELIAGIEITAIEGGRDVHVLGYFINARDSELSGFLAKQRAQRIMRVRAIGDRLAQLGMPVDITPLVAGPTPHGGYSVGRPQVARAMIAAGYVADTTEAFERWLATGRPAFVPRTGSTPEQVFAVIHAAGGIASLAHPGQTGVDVRIAAYVESGLDALEVFHPDHDKSSTDRYRGVAASLNLLVTGGSDFHGDPSHGWEPGAVSLPEEEWLRLRHAASHA